MARYLGFKRISYGLFMFADFADMQFSINRKSLASIKYQSNQPTCNSFVILPNLSFFVLGFNVDHSKLMRLSFCHGLSWFANITNSKPKKIIEGKEIEIILTLRKWRRMKQTKIMFLKIQKIKLFNFLTIL